MSVYVIDAHSTSLADLSLTDLAAAVAAPDLLEPRAEAPRLEIVLDDAAGDFAMWSAESAEETAEAASLDAILPAEELVLMPHEELAFRVAAIEATAIAKLDALIKDLQVNQPRRGRHAADEITFSIRSFLGGRGARHLAEAAAAA
jgi:hypothetical protein